MFGSNILDTVVGLIFVYLLVSLMVTAATELIAAWLSWRADKLWEGIRNLLSSPEAEDWARKLYDHILIKGLSPPASKKSSGRKMQLVPAAKGPSYIPAHTFSVALLDLIHGLEPAVLTIRKNLQEVLDAVPSSGVSLADVKKQIASVVGAIPMSSSLTEKVKADLQILANSIPDSDPSMNQLTKEIQAAINRLPDLDSIRINLKRDLQNLISRTASPNYSATNLRSDFQETIKNVPFSGSTGVQAVKKDLQEVISRFPLIGDPGTLAKQALQSFADKMLDKYFVDLLDHISNESLRKTLGLLFETSGHDFKKFQVAIENWFNDAMDRVSGWYKRQTQVAHLLLGIGFTFALNLDSVLIVKVLSSRSSGLGESLTAQAQKFTEHRAVQIEVGQAAQPSANPTSPDSQRRLDVASPNPEDDYRLLKSQLDRLDLPVGWTTLENPHPGDAVIHSGNPDFRQWPGWTWQRVGFDQWIRNWSSTIRHHLIGWALTAIAVSLGAPFWFDLLNRVMTIRSAGSAPQDRAKRTP